MAVLNLLIWPIFLRKPIHKTIFKRVARRDLAETSSILPNFTSILAYGTGSRAATRMS